MSMLLVSQSSDSNWIVPEVPRFIQLGPSTLAVPEQLSNGGGKNVVHSPAEWGADFSALCTTSATLWPLQQSHFLPHWGRYNMAVIFKRICLNENVSISLKISLKFVPKVQFNNIPALLQIMAWRRPGNKPLSEPTVVSLLTHICVTRTQWVNPGPRVLSLTVHGT